MATKYTTGPWEVKTKVHKLSGNDKVTDYHVYSGRDFICTTHAPHDLLINALEHEAVCKFNAYLIAAAPEMLESLEGLSDILNNHYGDDPEETPLIDNAFKAINKAKGL